MRWIANNRSIAPVQTIGKVGRKEASPSRKTKRVDADALQSTHVD